MFGARNLGGAIIDKLIADGWAMAGVAGATGAGVHDVLSMVACRPLSRKLRGKYF